jgi:uncharacterized protein (DUF362 family)
MHRRRFLQWSAAAPVMRAGLAATGSGIPKYRVVSPHSPSPQKGFPGQVVSLHSAKVIDEASGNADPEVVKRMLSTGMTALTGESTSLNAWRRFFTSSDYVGIKVNCSGAPKVMSNPVVVGAIVANLIEAGVKPDRITIYERFAGQLNSVNYGRYCDSAVTIKAVEEPHGSLRNYDPAVYAEVNFFGEENTRSNLIRLVSERFTKIINVPNMKDHGAAGVTGCLKNMAYGNFSNVARSHSYEKTHTKTFIGTLAAIEPLRSRTVLHIMDGLKGVWHGGPFADDPRYSFYPKKIMFGTDPVSMDRILLDIIEAKRKAENAVSVWDRSPAHVVRGQVHNANENHFIREPGHIEYASAQGLGVYDRGKIRLQEIEL